MTKCRFTYTEATDTDDEEEESSTQLLDLRQAHEPPEKTVGANENALNPRDIALDLGR